MENQFQTIVINLAGGPGSGKSTTAAGVFYELKKFQCKEILNKVIGRIKNEKTT